MITIENSIPIKTSSFLNGLDVFYTQFNDVDFYIEDEDQENFYYEILSNLFATISIKKIFPLKGKSNVITKSKKHIGDKKKVFIVDKDFDDLLGKKINQVNLFYLDQYSIENYLVDELAFKKYIIEEKPKLKQSQIDRVFKLNKYQKEVISLFYEVSILHLLTQSKNIPIKNTSVPAEKFINFSYPPTLKTVILNRYKNEIQRELTNIDRRLKLDRQLVNLKRACNIKNCVDFTKHVPGKYLIAFYKHVIEHLFNLSNRNTDSFVYRLAKNNSFSNLAFLQTSINSYIN